MNVIEEFIISLGVDQKKLKKELKNADGNIKDFIGNTVKAFAALYSINWAKEQLNQFAEVADESMKFANQINASLTPFLELQGAVVKSGGSIDGFRSSLTSLSGTISDASLGLGRGKVIFEQLGIEIKDSNGEIKDVVSVFMELNKSLQGLSSAEQIGYAKKLGIDSNTLRTLQQTPEALDELIVAQRKFGIITEDQVKVVEIYNDSVDDMRQAWGTLVAMFAQVLLPMMTNVNRVFTQMFVVIKNNKEFFITFFTLFSGVILYALIPAMKALALTMLKTLIPTFWASAVAGWAMVAPLIPFIAWGTLVAVAIAYIVDEFLAWREGGETTIGLIFDGFVKFGKLVKGLAKDIAKWFGDMWTNIKGGFNTFIGFITGIRDAIAGVFTGVFDGLVSGMEFIKEKLNFILEPLGKIKDALGGFFGGGNAKAVQTTQARSIQNNSNKSNTANIGQINVNLKKGNAKEIANNIAPALKGNFAWGSAGGIL